MTAYLLRTDDPDEASRIFTDAARGYIDERRRRIDSFVDRNFTVAGSLDLHRVALGWDLVRAPANIALCLPTAATRLAAFGVRRAGGERAADWLDDRHFFLETDVDREIRWRLHAELLELPLIQKERSYDRDALTEAVLAHPAMAAVVGEVEAVAAERAGDPDFRARLEKTAMRYIGARAAASEIATMALSSGAGVMAFHKITPSAISLGPAIATAITHHAAVASFPLGAGAGGLWYGLFPAVPPGMLVAGVTGGIVAGVAGLAAFAGVAADPLQRRLRLHHRRLHRLLDVLEDDLVHGRAARLSIRSHYVARVVDLVDFLRTAYSLAR